MALGIRLPSVVSAARGAATRKTFSLFALTVALLGCEDTGGDKADGGEEPPPPAGAILLTDENNYTTVAALTPPDIETASGEDLQISWTNLTRDMQCHTMSPSADIDKVALIRFQNVTKEDAAVALTAGELDMTDVSGYVQFDTDGSQTTASLSDLSVFGSDFNIERDYTEEGTRVYMMLWATGTSPGTGARTMAFLTPTVGATNTRVVATPGCDENGEGILEFEATLATPAEAGSTLVDWRGITVDGLGNPLSYGNVSSVLLGFYGNMTPEQIQANIFDLELMATDLWEAEHTGGKTADLQAAVHRERGETFTSFEDHGGDGTWLVGLMCSRCQNPAPLALVILEPVAAEP